MNKGLISALIISIAGSLIFVLVLPSYKEVNIAKEGLTKRQETQVEIKNIQANIAKLISEYESNREEVSKAGMALPEKNQLDYIISTFQAMATDKQVDIQSVSTDKPILALALGEGIEQTQIKLELASSYKLLFSFIEAIETNSRLFNITKMNIAPADNDGTDSYKIGMTITAYLINPTVKKTQTRPAAAPAEPQ